MASSEVVKELVTVLGFKVDKNGIIQARSSVNSFKSFAMKAFAAIGAIQLGRGAFQLTSDIDNAKASMTALTGSGEKTAEMMTQLRAMSEQLRPSWTQFSDAAKQLLVYGVSAEKVVEITRQLTDVSGGSNVMFSRLAYALGQINSAGILRGQDLRQLTEAGFNPLDTMAKATGKTSEYYRELMKKSMISSAAVFKALQIETSAGGRFFGVADKQAKTLGGSIDVLRNNLKNMSYDLMNIVSPSIIRIANRMKEWAKTSLLPWMKAHKAEIKKIGDDLFGILEKLGPAILTTFKLLGPLLFLMINNLPIVISLWMGLKALELVKFFISFGVEAIILSNSLKGLIAVVFPALVSSLESIYLAFLYIKQGEFAVVFVNMAKGIVFLKKAFLAWAPVVLLGAFALMTLYYWWTMWDRIQNQSKYQENLRESAKAVKELTDLEIARSKLFKTMNQPGGALNGGVDYLQEKSQLKKLDDQIHEAKLRKQNMDILLGESMQQPFLESTVLGGANDYVNKMTFGFVDIAKSLDNMKTNRANQYTSYPNGGFDPNNAPFDPRTNAPLQTPFRDRTLPGVGPTLNQATTINVTANGLTPKDFEKTVADTVKTTVISQHRAMWGKVIGEANQ